MSSLTIFLSKYTQPEFDAFQWVSEKDAAELVYPSLLPLFGGYTATTQGEQTEKLS